MTQQQMIELVQLHHPDVPPNIVRIWLNEKRRELAHAAGLNRTYTDLTTVTGAAKYALTSGMVDIYRVDLDGVRLDRLTGEPPVITSTVTVVEEVGP
jgi:hypothetical protein